MTDLKVCSINVRGLGEQLKRREIFNRLRAKNTQFIYSRKLIVQKTPILYGPRSGASNPCLPHIPPPAEELLSSLNNNFTFQLQRSFLDNRGRSILCDIKANEKLIHPCHAAAILDMTYVL